MLAPIQQHLCSCHVVIPPLLSLSPVSGSARVLRALRFHKMRSRSWTIQAMAFTSWCVCSFVVCWLFGCLLACLLAWFEGCAPALASHTQTHLTMLNWFGILLAERSHTKDKFHHAVRRASPRVFPHILLLLRHPRPVQDQPVQRGHYRRAGCVSAVPQPTSKREESLLHLLLHLPLHSFTLAPSLVYSFTYPFTYSFTHSLIVFGSLVFVCTRSVCKLLHLNNMRLFKYDLETALHQISYVIGKDQQCRPRCCILCLALLSCVARLTPCCCAHRRLCSPPLSLHAGNLAQSSDERVRVCALQ